MTEQVAIDLMFFTGGFLVAAGLLYTEVRTERRMRKLIEAMNERHNQRILESKTGTVKILTKIHWPDAPRSR